MKKQCKEEGIPYTGMSYGSLKHNARRWQRAAENRCKVIGIAAKERKRQKVAQGIDYIANAWKRFRSNVNLPIAHGLTRARYRRIERKHLKGSTHTIVSRKANSANRKVKKELKRQEANKAVASIGLANVSPSLSSGSRVIQLLETQPVTDTQQQQKQPQQQGPTKKRSQDEANEERNLAPWKTESNITEDAKYAAAVAAEESENSEVEKPDEYIGSAPKHDYDVLRNLCARCYSLGSYTVKGLFRQDFMATLCQDCYSTAAYINGIKPRKALSDCSGNSCEDVTDVRA